ncbi:hypothetical protein BJ508DRAFT_315715 [Ascobolus immersus RN42]|uniref:Ty3 transposon capsid-like protein domain-containing protein n=1 Tax=Ascobolus immersus RN42 TaxID=1160509 RepID=A0A3N4HDL0_ASCIM|nr:hypothetical protein BJ508DRAFT_315715 [Ascobolus immersus RN42]
MKPTASSISLTDLPYDPIAAAIDHKFEEIRFTGQQAFAAHDGALASQLADQEYHSKVTHALQQKMDATERENARLLHGVQTLLSQVADLRAQTTTISGATTTTINCGSKEAWEGSNRALALVTVDITVPRAYKMQIQVLPLQTFEGASDVDTVYLFLKQLDKRIRLLHTFNDIQKIEFAISYTSGTANRWATDEWYMSCRTISWLQFVADFKKRRVSANAPVMYLRKIKDPTILSTINHVSLTTGGINLETLLKYTATLIVRKLAGQPVKPSPSTATQPSTKEGNRSTLPSYRASKKGNKVSVNAIDSTISDSESTTEAVQAIADTKPQKPRSPQYPVRRCFFCDDPTHIQVDCEAKKELMSRLKAGKV